MVGAKPWASPRQASLPPYIRPKGLSGLGQREKPERQEPEAGSHGVLVTLPNDLSSI